VQHRVASVGDVGGRRHTRTADSRDSGGLAWTGLDWSRETVGELAAAPRDGGDDVEAIERGGGPSQQRQLETATEYDSSTWAHQNSRRSGGPLTSAMKNSAGNSTQHGWTDGLETVGRLRNWSHDRVGSQEFVSGRPSEDSHVRRVPEHRLRGDVPDRDTRTSGLEGERRDGELHFCGLGCLLEFCTDESNFPVCKSTGEMPTDKILVYQPALEIKEAVAAATAGGCRDV